MRPAKKSSSSTSRASSTFRSFPSFVKQSCRRSISWRLERPSAESPLPNEPADQSSHREGASAGHFSGTGAYWIGPLANRQPRVRNDRAQQDGEGAGGD